jgi:hypothetical protein
MYDIIRKRIDRLIYKYTCRDIQHNDMCDELMNKTYSIKMALDDKLSINEYYGKIYRNKHVYTNRYNETSWRLNILDKAGLLTTVYIE